MLMKPDQRLVYFYELWTMKESYVKALGKGLHLPMDSFKIQYKRESGYVIEDEDGAVGYRDIDLLFC